MSTPSPPPPRLSFAPANPRGTLGWGIAVFYITLTVGYIFCVGLVQMLRSHLSENALLLAYALGAWLFPLGAGLVYALRGKTRTAIGVLLGFGLLLGLGAALIAVSLGYRAISS